MPLTQAELEPMLQLALVPGVGPGRLAALIRTFGSAEAVFAAPQHQLRGVPGIGDALSRRIRGSTGRQARSATRTAIERMHEIGALALTPDDPLYPPAYRTVTDPPYLLFLAGDATLLERDGLAIVGTRSPTHYGRTTARRLAYDLAGAGVTITSGVARGIDSAAHLGALDAGGGTIGVLGHGIDLVYPPENRELFGRLREQGLILTEYPPGETPKAGNFPRRNRLIAALCRATLVVEMSHRSGAQHTVGFALEQGKEVMAVPGPVGCESSQGTNQLIRDGARLVTCARDVLEELYGVGTQPPGGEGRESVVATAPAPIRTAEESRVLALLGVTPRHVDELAREAGMEMGMLLTVLLELELRGDLDGLPGQRYCLRLS